ncbi:MAG: peptidase T [Chloroflexota bacterium]
MSMKEDITQRFLRYVQVDTQSDESSSDVPSSSNQLDLLNILIEELHEMGASDVKLSDYGVVFATVPATIPSASPPSVPTVAFLAHVDTAPAFNGTGVKPILHADYDGQPIILPDDPTQILSPETVPALADKTGEDIITASGKTLLGADDKAGVAIIMSMAAELLAHPEIPHGEIRLCFTTDEEIGRGVMYLKLDDLNADVAYTLDGGDVGEIVFETFSADKALVKVQGISTHPGDAKDKLVNALHLAAKIVDTLPQVTRTPETTAERDGFIHLYQMQGTAAEAELHFILRDFELEGLASHGTMVQSVCDTIQAAEPRAQISCEITPQYRNMRYWLEKDMRPVELAVAAIESCGLAPISKPIRGGTDGSGLTQMGVPTPNLFTGMQNIHGPLEWVSVQDMLKATEVCIQLVQLWAK